MWAAEVFRLFGTRCRFCPAAARDPHHVVYRQHLEDRGQWPWDPRDGLPLCRDCHNAHHGNAKLPVTALLAENLDYAFEALGAYAYDYLRRYYTGPDPRLESRLARAA